MTSYPASPSARRLEATPPPDMMASAMASPMGHSSLNTMYISVQAMKERCVRNQRHIDQLEDENRRLNQRHRRYEADIRRLREDNIRSGKRIEELYLTLSERTQEVEDLQAQIQLADKIQREEREQRLYEEEFPLLGTTNASSASTSILTSDGSQDLGYRVSDEPKSYQMDIDDGEDLEEALMRECAAAQARMERVKNRLLAQQKFLKKIIPFMMLPKPVANETSPEPDSNDSLITETVSFESPRSETASSELSRSETVSNESPRFEAASLPLTGPRVCPMCESQFSVTRFTQEDFEAHVLAHFQVDDEEESRTLIPFDQYDFVSDASW